MIFSLHAPSFFPTFFLSSTSLFLSPRASPPDTAGASVDVPGKRVKTVPTNSINCRKLPSSIFETIFGWCGMFISLIFGNAFPQPLIFAALLRLFPPPFYLPPPSTTNNPTQILGRPFIPCPDEVIPCLSALSFFLSKFPRTVFDWLPFFSSFFFSARLRRLIFLAPRRMRVLSPVEHGSFIVRFFPLLVHSQDLKCTDGSWFLVAAVIQAFHQQSYSTISPLFLFALPPLTGFL